MTIGVAVGHTQGCRTDDKNLQLSSIPEELFAGLLPLMFWKPQMLLEATDAVSDLELQQHSSACFQRARRASSHLS